MIVKEDLDAEKEGSIEEKKDEPEKTEGRKSPRTVKEPFEQKSGKKPEIDRQFHS